MHTYQIASANLKFRSAQLGLAMLALASLLQGCATTAPVAAHSAAADAAYQQHMQKIAGIKDFSIQGKIGIQTESKGFSGGLNWQHTPENDQIALYTPLGSQIANIQKTPEKVTLEDDRGNSISASSAEMLTQNTLGWQLPLTGLADWSMGRPTNSKIANIHWNEKGQITQLSQDGWDIEYDEYNESEGYQLPNKLYLRSPKVNIKLIVKSRNQPPK